MYYVFVQVLSPWSLWPEQQVRRLDKRVSISRTQPMEIIKIKIQNIWKNKEEQETQLMANERRRLLDVSSS